MHGGRFALFWSVSMSGLRSVSDLVARCAVEDVVVQMFVATDERDWPVMEACFTDPFTLDMTSMVGGTPVEVSPAQVAEQWAAAFRPLDHVHHQIGNMRTEVLGGIARVHCYGVAFHHRSQASPGKSRIFVGTYELQLQASADRWRISRLKFVLKFLDGNPDLETSG